ncbi:slr1658 superfamily regulator [Allocoleopsis sp.]|uniref:slr1658 superfamily regulator n=1 Tax=Allocoleopsis sp. TaxID=3088169 RepID=UPI002FD5AABA
MNQIIGDFIEEALDNHKLFMIEFLIHAIPIERRKPIRYLSMAFVADYLANVFPITEENATSFGQQLHLKSAATYMTNELLENSMKFHDGNINYPVKFGICLFEKNLVFIGSNCVNQTCLAKFNDFIDELTHSDIDELYFRQLEKGAEEKSEESQLGFLSMMNDYSAKLGWKIETVRKDVEITTLTTMVQLTI